MFIGKWKNKWLTYALSASLAVTSAILPAGAVTAQEQAGVGIDPAGLEAQSGQENSYSQQEWQQWLSENVETIDTLDAQSGSFEDLQFLKEVLKDKKFVLLGESSHGAAEFNQAKVRLIEFLHKEMDFNVLAFESGLGETSSAYAQIRSTSAEETLKKSIYGVWHTEELLPLFQYMKKQAPSARPLELTGFDMQPGMLAPVLEEWFSAVNEEMAQEAFELEIAVTQMFYMETNEENWKAEVDQLVQRYDALIQFVEENKEALEAEFAKNNKMIPIIKRVFEDRQYMLQNAMRAQIAFNAAMEREEFDISESVFDNIIYWRDRMMADTLFWLSEYVYPDQKIIVWGHNYHLRKNNTLMTQSMDIHPHSEGAIPTMGELLPYKFKRHSYSIGFFMNEGETLGNDGSVFPVKEDHDPNSIEAILQGAEGPYTFVNFDKLPLNEQTSWMYTPREGLYWGLIEEIFVPVQQYDGILFIERTSAAQYLEED